MKKIAMKCTQEDWETIRPILLDNGFKDNTYGGFKNNPYIANHISKVIGNYHKMDLNKDRVFYKTFNAKIFLEACGIEVEEKYEITKEQILELSNNFGNDNKSGLRSNLTSKLEQWFPDAFKKDFTG